MATRKKNGSRKIARIKVSNPRRSHINVFIRDPEGFLTLIKLILASASTKK